MGSVWKRLNRINKRASKFRFSAAYSELWLEAGPHWQPTALSVIWTRKSRRVASDPVRWEPTMKNPYIGMCVWPVPEQKDISVTMFRDPIKDDYDNKDWFFILEDVNQQGKRKPVAQGRLNMKDFCSAEPTEYNLTVKLRPVSKKVTAAKLTLSLTAELLREGMAKDEDMRSIASLVSNSTMSGDYGNHILDQLEEEPGDESASATVQASIASMTREMDRLSRKASLEPDPLPGRSVSAGPEAPFPLRAVAASPPEVPPRSLSAKPELVTRSATSVSPKTQFTGPANDEGVSATDENENKARLPRIKKIDILPKAEPKGFGSRGIKSTYNGPMGEYKNKKVSDADNPGTDPDPQPPPVQPRSPSLLAQPPPAPVQPRSPSLLAQLPPVQPRSPSLLPAAPVAAAKPVVEEEPRLNLSKNDILVTADMEHERVESVIEEAPEINDQVEDEKEKILSPVNYQRSKSQEFREYEQEFLRMSLQPISDERLVTSTPVTKQSARAKSPISSVFRMPSPIKNMPDIMKSVNNENNDLVKVTPSPTKEEMKLSITPSRSFLMDLNQNSNADNSSSESTPVTEKSKPPTDPRMEKILADRTNSLLRKTPTKTSDDLLDWSKEILSKYSNVKVTNFTTSWRNGLAFCALIHSFYPDLVQYDTLIAQDIKQNCKIAFEAGEKLGIPRVIEPESMVIKRIPDKLAVITYLHQLRSCLGQEEATALYTKCQQEQQLPNTGVRKSFSFSGGILFSRSNSDDAASDLPTIQETPNIDIKPDKISEYKERAKNIFEQSRSDKSFHEENVSDGRIKNSSPPKVIMRQKSTSTKSKKDNRLSYIDNEMKALDREQMEIDKQASILDRRLRETSEDDQLVYDALLQQWFTLVNKKNALLRRQMQLNILEKEDDLEKKLAMLQNELRSLSEIEESFKTDDDRKREELLLEELVLVVNKRNELVIQRDQEEEMLRAEEELDERVTLPENEHLRNNKREECRMQ